MVYLTHEALAAPLAYSALLIAIAKIAFLKQLSLFQPAGRSRAQHLEESLG